MKDEQRTMSQKREQLLYKDRIKYLRLKEIGSKMRFEIEKFPKYQRESLKNDSK